MSFALSAGAVGTVLDRQHFDVTFRMTSAYAAAIGAQEDIYLYDGMPGGAVAPPAFQVVIEWPLLLRQPYIGSIGAREEGYFECLLHAFQDTHFHRLVRAGDRLEVTATLVSVRPTSAGALVVCRLDTRCLVDGGPVATSWIGSLFKGRPVQGEPRFSEIVPELGTVERAAGSYTEHIPLSRSLPFIYTECSGHWNPIHTQRTFAQAAGHPDRVLHGTSSWAIACQRLIDRWGGGRPESLRRYGARFSGLLLPGEAIDIHHHRGGGPGTPVMFSADNARGHPVLSRGIAEFSL